jgi:CheY-like chemotaxis protein
MNAKDYIDRLLDLVRIAASWPIVVLIIALVFRGELRLILPELVKRLRKAPGGFEFGTEELALRNAIEIGAQEFSDRPKEFVDFAKNQVEKLLQGRSMSALVERTSLAGNRVLWVDDKPVNNTYEASLLKSMGAKVDMVRSTKEAMDAVEQTSYDLIISDVRRLEDGNVNAEAGYQLLERLMARAIRIPVVFYTGTVKTLDRARTKSAFGVAHRSAELMTLVISALARTT